MAHHVLGLGNHARRGLWSDSVGCERNLLKKLQDADWVACFLEYDVDWVSSGLLTSFSIELKLNRSETEPSLFLIFAERDGTPTCTTIPSLLLTALLRTAIWTRIVEAKAGLTSCSSVGTSSRCISS